MWGDAIHPLPASASCPTPTHPFNPTPPLSLSLSQSTGSATPLMDSTTPLFRLIHLWKSSQKYKNKIQLLSTGSSKDITALGCENYISNNLSLFLAEFSSSKKTVFPLDCSFLAFNCALLGFSLRTRKAGKDNDDRSGWKPSFHYPAGARRAPAGPKGRKAPNGPFGPLGQSACFGAGCYIEMATLCH